MEVARGKLAVNLSCDLFQPPRPLAMDAAIADRRYLAPAVASPNPPPPSLSLSLARSLSGSTILDTRISFEKVWLLCCNEKGVAQSAS